MDRHKMILLLRLHASLRRSLRQEIGEIGDQSLNEQSIDQQIEQIEHLDGLTITVGPNSLIRTVKASRLTSDLRLKSRSKAPAGPSGDREEQADHTMFHVIVLIDNKLPRGITLYERLPAELLPANMKFCPLCNIPKKSHIKRHILRTHLPWFWSPTTACWACEEQSCHESSLMYHHSVIHAHNDSNTFDKTNLHRWCQLMNGAFYLLLDWLRLESLHD
jgi:hypothetical protein